MCRCCCNSCILRMCHSPAVVIPHMHPKKRTTCITSLPICPHRKSKGHMAACFSSANSQRHVVTQLLHTHSQVIIAVTVPEIWVDHPIKHQPMSLVPPPSGHTRQPFPISQLKPAGRLSLLLLLPPPRLLQLKIHGYLRCTYAPATLDLAIFKKFCSACSR